MRKTVLTLGMALAAVLFLGAGVALAAEPGAGGTNWVKVA